MVFIGVLLHTFTLKSGHEYLRLLYATGGMRGDIFCCVMVNNRFLVLLTCFRFDNKMTEINARKCSLLQNFFTVTISKNSEV
jgi:hypothetical protein